MTEKAVDGSCGWCGRRFEQKAGRGRPRRFCRQACRQRDYVSRLRAQEAGLSEAELIVTRQELDELRDRLYELECLLTDARADLAAGDDPAEVLRSLLEGANFT